jgi:hypothetical protein
MRETRRGQALVSATLDHLANPALVCKNASQSWLNDLLFSYASDPTERERYSPIPNPGSP